MRLGFGVVLLPVHHPLHVAVKTATLDVISGGRVDVGVGRSGNSSGSRPLSVEARCQKVRGYKGYGLGFLTLVVEGNAPAIKNTKEAPELQLSAPGDCRRWLRRKVLSSSTR